MIFQKLDRDTQKCAYKCSYVTINGEGVSVRDTVDLGSRAQSNRDEIFSATCARTRRRTRASEARRGD